jgi:hypothetical protein
MKTYVLYTIHINETNHITLSSHHNRQKRMPLIINDLSAKTHEIIGNKPAKPSNTYQKYPY